MNKQFDTMMDRLSPTLKKITHRLNGHFSFFDDDDLFQEAAIYLWSTFQKGALSDKTDSYILQGCCFHLKNYLRTTLDKARLISLCHMANEDDKALKDMLAKENDSTFDEIDAEFLKATGRSRGLTDREEEVLELCLDGLTVRDIGKRLGVSHVMVIKVKNKIRAKCWNLRHVGYQ